MSEAARQIVNVYFVNHVALVAIGVIALAGMTGLVWLFAKTGGKSEPIATAVAIVFVVGVGCIAVGGYGMIKATTAPVLVLDDYNFANKDYDQYLEVDDE